jgi:hypothetical protein
MEIPLASPNQIPLPSPFLRGKPEEASPLTSRGTLSRFSPLFKGGWGDQRVCKQTLGERGKILSSLIPAKNKRDGEKIVKGFWGNLECQSCAGISKLATRARSLKLKLVTV